MRILFGKGKRQDICCILSLHSLSLEAVDDALFDTWKRCSDSHLPGRLPQIIGDFSSSLS